jgi:two-component system, NtrC family, sensor kinase
VTTGQQVVRIPDVESHTLAVSTPIYSQGKLTGGVRLHLLLGPDRFGWPRLFWMLMVINGLVLVLFVALVVTRYVIRPVEAMQRAAAQASEGDLSVRLAAGGARELESLAGSFNEMTAAVQDQLTRLDRQRQELATSREVLIRSEKLASVGRLAAGVAHEVGNPLQSIVGFTELLLSGDMSDEERADFLQRVRHETERIHHIIRELLDFARPVEDEPEPVKLAQVVEQSLQLVGPQKRLREVEVTCQGLEDMPTVSANGPRLIQVLVNLLLNAADAMDGDGHITIAGVHREAEGLGELTVSNDGAPIPEAHRDQIFDPFFTTKDPGQGTGLGLSVARSIIESHGGTLELTSVDPPTFSIQLPVWKEG